MKAWIVPPLLAFLLTATAASAAIAIRSFVDDMRRTDGVAEGTVLLARVYTFQAHGETRLCGMAYEMLVDDLISGHQPQIRTLGAYFWSDQNRMRGLTGRMGLAAGRTYFFGITRNAIQHYGLDTLVRYESGDDKAHPEIRTCLGKLPRDFVIRPTEILGPPDRPSDQYLRIPATEAVDDSEVAGSYRETYTPSKPVLEDPNRVVTSVDIELDTYNYDQKVPYDAIKRLFGLGGSVKNAPEAGR